LSGIALGQEKAKSANEDTATADKVQLIFREKCAECHGPQLKKPRAFGYILDLRRVAANPKFVVPFKSDKSGLWKLIITDEMPPEGSLGGPLTQTEKDLVLAWISRGAPAASREMVVAPEAPTSLSPTSRSSAVSLDSLPFSIRLLFWSGRFHLLVIHFPIALVIAAVLGEVLVWLGYRGLEATVRYCTGLAAISGVVAAALGWLLAWSGSGAGDVQLLDLHRWFGTGAAVLLVLAWASAELDARRARRAFRSRILLISGACLIGVAGHLGGSLVHGVEYLSW
jgi:uncharacterized membrane protein